MNILEALEKSNKIENLPRGITIKIDERGYLFIRDNKNLKIGDITSHAWQPIIEPLNFEKIKTECVPGESLLIDENEKDRLFLGFTRMGRIVVEDSKGIDAIAYAECTIRHWKISDEKWGGE